MASDGSIMLHFEGHTPKSSWTTQIGFDGFFCLFLILGGVGTVKNSENKHHGTLKALIYFKNEKGLYKQTITWKIVT